MRIRYCETHIETLPAPIFATNLDRVWPITVPMRAIPLRSHAIAAMLACSPRHTPPHLNFFSQFMPQPQSTPADVYRPDADAQPAGLPKSYDELHNTAIAGVKAVIAEGVHAAVEVDFPPIANVNARGDGSAKSERLVLEANVEFVSKLKQALMESKMKCLVVGCSRGSVTALGSGAVSLRDAPAIAPDFDVCVVTAPVAEEQWNSARSLGARCVVVVNGLLQNGELPHAYFYRPMTAFSAQTGGVCRRYPGRYEVYDINGRLLDMEIDLCVQGKRALPDTKAAQMRLQNEFGKQ